MRKTIKDSNLRVLGYIDEDFSGNKIAYNSSLRVVAYYDKNQDITKDASLRVVAYGDVTSAFIFNK